MDATTINDVVDNLALHLNVAADALREIVPVLVAETRSAGLVHAGVGLSAVCLGVALCFAGGRFAAWGLKKYHDNGDVLAGVMLACALMCVLSIPAFIEGLQALNHGLTAYLAPTKTLLEGLMR